MASARPRPMVYIHNPRLHFRNPPLFTNCFSSSEGWKPESSLPALWIEPRPSRVRGGDHNHLTTQTDSCFYVHDSNENWIMGYYMLLLFIGSWKVGSTQQRAESSANCKFILRPCHYDESYIDGQSQIKVHRWTDTGSQRSVFPDALNLCPFVIVTPIRRLSRYGAITPVAE